MKASILGFSTNFIAYNGETAKAFDKVVVVKTGRGLVIAVCVPKKTFFPNPEIDIEYFEYRTGARCWRGDFPEYFENFPQLNAPLTEEEQTEPVQIDNLHSYDFFNLTRA